MATSKTAAEAAEIAERTLVVTRVLNAPRELVVKAWADPAVMVRWWGPNGFTNSILDAQFQDGGHLHYIMHGPDGVDYPNYVKFIEFDLPTRLVYEHGAFAGDPGSFRAEVTFEDLGAKTKVTLKNTLVSKEAADGARKWGAVEGGQQTLERLEKAINLHLKEFTVERVVEAPLELVWKAYSEARRMERWWGPAGFSCTIPKMAFVPGGVTHYCLKSDQGFEMWGLLKYRRIVPMESITALVSFSDATGGTTRHPGEPEWPLEMHSITSFAKVGDKTRISVKWSPVHEKDAERAVFDRSFPSMEEGFKGTFEGLTAYLEEAQAPGAADPYAKPLVIVRELDAPKDLVWKAWTDPEMLKKWWGPKGFTCPTAKVDFRVGGKYLLCMKSADGNEMWTTGTFKEIIPGSKFVTTDSFADKDGNVVPSTHYGMEGFPLELKWTVSFEVAGGKTRMTLVHEGMPGGFLSDMTHSGWSESFDKLEVGLTIGAPRMKPDWELRITRSFDAPKALIWEVFTKPEHLAHWWGPEGFTLPLCEMDFRDGGKFVWGMRAPDGSDHPMRGTFADIVAGESFTQVTRLDDFGDLPHQIVGLFSFSEKDGKAVVAIHQTYAGVDAALESDAKAGWESSARRIDAYLAGRKGK